MDSSPATAARERTQPVAQLILGVPGQWATRSDAVTAIATQSHGLVLAGDHLRDEASGAVLEADIRKHDPRLRRAFEIAGRGSLSDADLRAIDVHQHIVYVIGEGESPESARLMLRVGRRLLDAGGVAVKVESSGVAHSAQAWQALAADGSDHALYRAFVMLISSERGSYSCGMHAMGMRDAFVIGVDREAGAAVADAFLRYVLTERPSLATGETFSRRPSEPAFRLSQVPCETYEPDDPFFNPFGYWLLTRL